MTEIIEIPAEWQQMHWKKQVALAHEIAVANGKPKDELEAAEARAIIDNETRRRADETRAPVPVKPVVPKEEPKVQLKLLRDTWQGETRIRADGRVTEWSLADAKRLIAQGVAERADPLPGE